MKAFLLGGMPAALLLQTSIAIAETVPFQSNAWEIDGAETRIEMYEDEIALYLQNGAAILRDVNFTNGIIEFDIAIPEDRGFSGAFWHLQDDQNYEEFYLRHHQSGNPDANQYQPVFNGITGWQIYFGPHYSAPLTYRHNVWQHVKIAVSGDQAEIYLDSDEPVLFIEDLKRDEKNGPIGLKSGFAGARFANFSYEKIPGLKLKGKPLEEAETVPDGLVANWEISDAFPESDIDAVMADINAGRSQFGWSSLPVETNGVANMARIQSPRIDGKNTAFAKLSVNALREQTVRINFGFSDRVKVFANGQPLYAGDDGFANRDYRFLGTVRQFDSVFVPLKSGENDIYFAVSESFGGWAITAVIEE